MLITDFADKKLREFMVYDNYRSIASYIDGFKPSTRKLLWNAEKAKKFMKVDAIANNTAGDSQYLHGAVNLEGVLKGLCNDYSGTNIIPLFDKEGFFGTRTEREPGASRYVKAKSKPLIELLYRKEDYEVLIKQEFEGYDIEPRYYVPILPTILINGSTGIGNGFSHNITSRLPKDVAKQIFDYLDGKSTSSTLPYFKDFKGTITQDIENNLKFYITGCITIKNTSTIIIDELPVSYSLSKYIKILDDLEDKKIIRSYVDKSNKNKFLFEIKCPRTTTQMDEEKLIKTFKLNTSITENLTLVDENNSIKVFDSTNQILENYINIRLEYYQKRKDYLITKMEHDLLVLKNKISFLEYVISGEVSFKGLSKKKLEDVLLKRKFTSIDDSYDYLLNMNIYNLTQDKLDILKMKLKELTAKLEEYSKKEISTMWKEEINNLLKALGERAIPIKTIVLPTPTGEDELYEEFKKTVVSETPKILINNEASGIEPNLDIKKLF